jgi:Flp pilus assembly protein TadD
MREGRLAEAEAHLARTLERMPALIAACENLAMVQAYRGDPVAARRTGDRCQEIFPDPDLAKDLAGMGVGQSP